MKIDSLNATMNYREVLELTDGRTAKRINKFCHLSMLIPKNRLPENFIAISLSRADMQKMLEIGTVNLEIFEIFDESHRIKSRKVQG